MGSIEIQSREANLPVFLEEDKRATTNVQNGLVSIFLLSLKKALI